jgi:hypothetical protein
MLAPLNDECAASRVLLHRRLNLIYDNVETNEPIVHTSFSSVVRYVHALRGAAVPPSAALRPTGRVPACDTEAAGGPIRGSVPARHRHGRDAVQRGDHGRGPDRQRPRSGHLLQLVLRVPLRVVHDRRHRHRLPPGWRLLGHRLRRLPRDLRGELGTAAPCATSRCRRRWTARTPRSHASRWPPCARLASMSGRLDRCSIM